MSAVRQYRLLRVLGRGGMAEVVEALAVAEGGFERRVALKRMLEGYETDASFGRMFLDEARISSQLHHANIVGILDYGVASGLPFQVLEFVDGLDLDHLVDQGKELGAVLPVELALHLCTEVAHALEYAHDAVDARGQPLGIVHRDVSPSNVLVGWAGDVKLTDFGIAMAQGRLERTRAGVVKGKLHYMAPEQVLAGQIDRRADVFALGCVLHALVSGQSPLATSRAQAAMLAGSELALDPSLPPDVREVIARATRRSREERYRTAGELADALGRALAARLSQDPRTLLKAWLARLREPVPAPPRRGKLDDLLGGGVEEELVFAGVDDQVRRFEARTISERPSAPTRPITQTAPSLQRRGNRSLLVGSALGLAVAGAALLWGLRAPEPAARGQAGLTPAAPGPAPSPPVQPPPVTPAVAMPVVAPVQVAVAKPAAVGAKKPKAVAAPRGSTDPGVTPPLVEAPPPVPPRQPLAGVVRIGGEGALRAEIYVDGASQGFAPRRLELPLGDHTFELKRPDGRRVGSVTMNVTALHTDSTPCRWDVPAAP